MVLSVRYGAIAAYGRSTISELVGEPEAGRSWVGFLRPMRKVTGTMMLPDGEIVITGDGLVLREWTSADIATMVELFDEQSIDDWTPLESPFDAAAAQRYLDQASRIREQGLGVQLAITTDGSAALGEVLVFDGYEPGMAELAYAVGVKFRGDRLGVRAVRLLIAFAEQSSGITGFELKISPANEASQRVAREAGFTRTDAPMGVRERKGRRLAMATWSR